MNQLKLIAAQLRDLADRMENEPKATVKNHSYKQDSFPGTNDFTGLVKLKLEVFLPSLKSGD